MNMELEATVLAEVDNMLVRIIYLLLQTSICAVCGTWLERTWSVYNLA